MIDLVAPTITEHDRNYLSRRIHTGLLEHDREVRKFEERFADTVGSVGAVAVCSGTAALQIALHILDIENVSIPTYTCVAIRNATHDRDLTLLDSTFDVRDAILSLPVFTGAAVIPHTFGKPTWIPANSHRTDSDAHTVEDWTLSLGGIQALTQGVLGVCSTHQTKMVSTGRGGVLFSNDRHLLHEARRLAYYENHTQPALSLGMSAMQAALGVSQLEQLDAFIERRQQIAAHYSQRFDQAGIECPDPNNGSVFFRYLIRVDDPASKLLELAERGVEAGRGVNPLLHQLAGERDSAYPGAVHDWVTLLSVPCHPSLTDRQAAFIADQVLEVCA